MFKITARVLPLPTIIDYSRYHADSVIPGFGRRLMTLAERDAKYPVLAGVDPGGDVELDLDDRRARQALEDQAAALIDPGGVVKNQVSTTCPIILIVVGVVDERRRVGGADIVHKGLGYAQIPGNILCHDGPQPIVCNGIVIADKFYFRNK